MSAQRVFVTGASGFIGGHIVERLAPTHRIAAMARSDRAAEQVERFGATPVRCALGAVEPTHLAGCDVIVHCAAYAEEWGTREQFYGMNAEGTAQLLTAARAAGVKRFVHLGTEAALFDGHDLIDIDESHPYPSKPQYLYSGSKAEAEKHVLAASAPDFETLSLRPRFVWGPRDTSVLPAVLRMAREGQWSWLDGGRAMTSTTHVYNITHAVSLALTKGAAGESYFIADDGERTLREFLTALAATQGVALPDRSIPGSVARPMARVIEGAWRTLKLQRTPPMTRFAIDMMSRTITVRTDKARRELGYVPVIGVAEGIARLRSERSVGQ